jgi:hypothetical protein
MKEEETRAKVFIHVLLCDVRIDSKLFCFEIKLNASFAFRIYMHILVFGKNLNKNNKKKSTLSTRVLY